MLRYSYGFDPTYILLVPALIISFWAQAKVNSAFNKYKQVRIMNGYTGEEVARQILNGAGLYDTPIEMVNTRLGDHYDPVNRVLRLSKEVYNGSTIAAAGIAAHEVGHAIQHKENYGPLSFRNSIFPIVNISSNLSWVIFLAGIVMSIRPLVSLGIIMFSVVVLFQIITLPVEFNASNRALNILENRGIIYGEELKGAKKVLDAAAMTYVAAAIMSISQLIRLLAISGRKNNE
ncbi:MAG: zinc metallopeptidase [Clostridium sp.]|nr:zinc metallopeptidase [Clostridium sp.]